MRSVSAADILKTAKTSAFLVTNLINIRYLTGLPVSAGLLLIHGKKLSLFEDARYHEMADRATKTVSVKDIAEIEAVLGTIRSCGFEADDVTVLRKANWKKRFAKTRFIPKTGVIEEYRRVKTPEELKLLKRAHRITRELLRRVPAVIRKPITEQQLARRLRIWALELGADDLSFEPIVAFGTHTACPHHRPTTRVLKKGNIVQIDVGAKVGGYCADMSQVYFTAPPTTVQKNLYATLLEAMKTAMALAKAGATNHQLDRAAREILEREAVNEYFTHALGHGVGLDIHEGPTLSSKARKQTLKAGEVLAVEPGVYFPGKFGMRLEEMVYVA